MRPLERRVLGRARKFVKTAPKTGKTDRGNSSGKKKKKKRGELKAKAPGSSGEMAAGAGLKTLWTGLHVGGEIVR